MLTAATVEPRQAPAAGNSSGLLAVSELDVRSISVPAAPAAAGGEAEGHVEPLGGGWITVAVCIGVMAALIAVGGMVLSFRAVSTEMIPAFGRQWSWLVPVVVDLTVFVFSGVDLVLARLDMGHPLARLTVYGATAGTVYLNFNAGGNLAGRVAHVLMPSIWVVFIELMRHVVRRQTNLATGSRREPIPASRWLVSPWPTLKLWRRMVLWRINSYPAALDMERQRLEAIAAARAVHGRSWRWRVDPLLRMRIALAEVGAREVYAHVTQVARPDTDRAMQQGTDQDTEGANEQDTKTRQSPPRKRAQSTAEKVRAARAKHPDWSRRQLAHALRVSERTVSRYLGPRAKDTGADD